MLRLRLPKMWNSCDGIGRCSDVTKDTRVGRYRHPFQESGTVKSTAQCPHRRAAPSNNRHSTTLDSTLSFFTTPYSDSSILSIFNTLSNISLKCLDMTDFKTVSTSVEVLDAYESMSFFLVTFWNVNFKLRPQTALLTIPSRLGSYNLY